LTPDRDIPEMSALLPTFAWRIDRTPLATSGYLDRRQPIVIGVPLSIYGSTIVLLTFPSHQGGQADV
jgi:hypothetical protein